MVLGTDCVAKSECPICGTVGTCQPVSVKKPVQVHLASYGYSVRALGLASGLYEVSALCVEKKCSACESEFASGADMDETIKNIVKALHEELGPPGMAPRKDPSDQKGIQQ